MYYDCNGNIIKDAKKTKKFNNLGVDSRNIPLCEFISKLATRKDGFLRTQIDYNNN